MTGDLCYKFARDVPYANIARLQETVLEKDTKGELCYRFVKDVLIHKST